MSRTYRKESHKVKGYNKKASGKKKKVRDGSFTRVSGHCECHGGCPYCESNRMYQKNKELERTEKQLKEYDTILENKD